MNDSDKITSNKNHQSRKITNIHWQLQEINKTAHINENPNNLQKSNEITIHTQTTKNHWNPLQITKNDGNQLHHVKSPTIT